MSVLDAQALIAFLTDEPARLDVEALLRDRADPAAIGAVNLAECVDVLVRVKGVPAAVATQALDLALESLEVVAVDAALARRAGELRARHYDRVRRPVSLADCLALASALMGGERLATSDPHLVAAARDEGCPVVALPYQDGRRPDGPDEPLAGS